MRYHVAAAGRCDYTYVHDWDAALARRADLVVKSAGLLTVHIHGEPTDAQGKVIGPEKVCPIPTHNKES